MTTLPSPYIIMPVKDSIDTTERAVRAIIDSGHTLTIYNDYSTPENTTRLQALSEELDFRLINLADEVDHPSPNYLWVLQHAQKTALQGLNDLIIIESDVIVRPDTINAMLMQAGEQVGMVAAVTHDEAENINFPYEYARHLQGDVVATKKRLSFCCTLLSHSLLSEYDFSTLDPKKNWYDVTISHRSLDLGYENRLMLTHSVLHLPHSSRPWKRLKYTHPLRYYWRKLTQGLDKI